MKRFLLSMLLALGFLIPALAQETQLLAEMPAVVSGNWPDESQYTNTIKSTNGEWTAVAFSNNNMSWSGDFRCGRKSVTSVGQIIKNAPIQGTVTSVVLSTGAKATKHNSVKIYVADNADFTGAETYAFVVPASNGTNKDYTVNISSPKTNAYYKLVVDMASGANGNFAVTALKFYGTIGEVDPDAVSTPTITFDKEKSTVTMGCETEDAVIYYTLDGSAPSAEATLYSAPFVIEESCTIKAIAVKGDKESSVATCEATVPAKAANIAEMLAKAPEKDNTVNVNFPMTVVYVNGLYVYVIDGEGGATMIYQTNSLNAGDVIPAGWEATNSPYGGMVEWKGSLPASTETAEFTIAEVETVTESDLYKVVVLKGVTFDAATLSDTSSNFNGTLADGTTLQFRNNFKIASVSAGTYDVKLAVGIYNGTLQAYPIEYTRVATALIDATPVIAPAEIMTEADGTFTFNPANFLEGIGDYALASDNEEMLTIDDLYYLAGTTTGTVSVDMIWEAGTIYNAGSANFEIVIKEREYKDAEISLLPLALELGDEGQFSITAPEGFMDDVKNFTLTSSDDETLLVDGTDYYAAATGTVTVTASWDKGLIYNGGTKTFEVAISPKTLKQTVTTTFDQFNSANWDPKFPTSSGTATSEEKSVNGELSVTHKNAYYNTSSSALLIVKGTGYLVLSKVEGVLKKITLHSGTGCSASAVVKVTADDNDLGTVALNTKNADFEISAEGKHIENPIVKIEATSAANVQITSITIETEVDVRPSAEISFPQREYKVLKGREDQFVKPVLTVAEGYDGTIEYTSNNPEVATVDNEGNITFGEVIGKAIITAVAPETDNYAYDEAFYILVYDDTTLPLAVTKDYDTFNTGWSPALPATASATRTEHERDGLKFAIRNAEREGAAIRLAKGTGAIRLLDIKGQLTGLAFYSNDGASQKAKINITANGQDLGIVELTSGNSVMPYRVNVPEDIVDPEILITATADAAVELSRIRVETREDKRPLAGFSYPMDEVNTILGAEVANALQDVPAGLAVSYTSSNEEVATVDAEGNVTIVGAGETTITAASEGTLDYRATTASYVLNVAEKLTFIVKIDGKAVVLEEDEDIEGSYTALASAYVGQAMTIATNLGENAMVMLWDLQAEDEESSMLMPPVTFAKEGAYRYAVLVFPVTEDGLSDEPLPATLQIGVDVTVKKGTKENPYTVADYKANAGSIKIEDAQEGIWVKGVIGGYATSGTNYTIVKGKIADTNLALVDNLGDKAFIPVQLTSDLRAELGVKSNPAIIGDVLYLNITAVNEQYFSVLGIKTIASYDLLVQEHEKLFLHVKVEGSNFDFTKAIEMTKNEEGMFVANANVGVNNDDEITFHYVFTTHVITAPEVEPAAAPRRRAEAVAADWAALTEGHVFHADGTTIASHIAAEDDLNPYTATSKGGNHYFQADVVGHALTADVTRAGDLTTGIDNIVVEDATEAVYFDLTGRRVAKPANGMYIRVVNGKATKVAIR